MHQALQVTEIASLIFSCLDSSKNRKELAFLGRACKAFHDIALDALWEHQDTVLNLLRCMPANIWATESSESGNDAQFLRSSDWDRALKKYGHRIRSLCCRDHHADRNLTVAYTNLQRGARECLLPNLETLSWEHYHPDRSAFISLFLGPRLTSLSIGDQYAGFAGVLATLGQRCPSLVSVVVDGVRAGSADSERQLLSQLLRGLTGVEVLDVGIVDCETLIHLGQLTTLTTLRVDLPVAPSFPSILDSSLYPNLREAKLYLEGKGASVSCLRTFLRTWNNPPIESFDVFLDDCAGFEQIGHLYEELATHCVHEHLQKLELKIYQTIPSFTHAGHILGPLFSFPHLRNVHIKVPEGYDMDDSLISDLARAWPHIKHLVLGTYNYYHPRNTLLGLYSLSQNCPHLATLEITLDASHIPPLPTHEARVLQHQLVWLDVAFSPISDAPGVAAFLGSLFLNLSDFGSDAGRVWEHAGVIGSDHYERWNEVERLLASGVGANGSLIL